jgi:signal transduction histidine kinase
LSISLTIIKDHLGTIEAHGAVGRGATFVVRLPVAEQLEEK